MDVTLMTPNMIQETLRKVDLLEYCNLRMCNKAMNKLGEATIRKCHHISNSELDIVITYKSIPEGLSYNIIATVKGANRIVVIEGDNIASFFCDIKNTTFKSIDVIEQWIEKTDDYNLEMEQNTLAVLKKIFDGVKLKCVKLSLKSYHFLALEGIRYLLSFTRFQELELDGQPYHTGLGAFDQLMEIKELKKASRLSLACTPPRTGLYDHFKSYQEVTLTCHFDRNTFINLRGLLNEIRGKDTSQYPIRVFNINYVHTELDVRHLEDNNLKLIYADPTPAMFRFHPKADYFYYVAESRTEIVLVIYGREDGIHSTTISRIFIFKNKEEVYLKIVELLSSFRHFYIPNPYDTSVVYQEFLDTEWDHMGPVIGQIEFYVRKFKGIDI